MVEVPHGSAQNVFSAGDEDAGAACLTPDTLVAVSRRPVIVVPREQLAIVDPQLSVEEMQLFCAGMVMRRVTGAGREAYQHADPVPLRVGRQQLAFDPGRDLFPFRLGPPSCRRQHRLLAGLLGDAKRKARLQRCRRTQHIGGPGDEPINHRAEALQFALAIRARGNVGFGRGNLARRQDLQGVGARYLALLATVAMTRTHGFPGSAVSVWRSLYSPERMRVLMVPS